MFHPPRKTKPPNVLRWDFHWGQGLLAKMQIPLSMHTRIGATLQYPASRAAS